MNNNTLIVAPTFPDLEGMDPEIERHVVRVPAVQRFNGSDFSVRFPLVGLMNPRLVKFEADLVHSHHPYLIGDTALRFAADKQAPVIFTHHTLYEEYLHYVPIKAALMRQFVIELSTHYANLCDAVIAPSESIAKLIRKRGVEVPVTVIPTGVDTKFFGGGSRDRFRRANGIDPECFVVGTVGRLAEEKNLDYLCRAVARFLCETPGSMFVAVGTGPSATPMREIFAERGLSERVLLPGKKSGQELYDAYKAMDLFAFASFTETQGLVVTEAMAAGLPVVALDASGVREVVRDGVNGLMLPANSDETNFAASLNRLFSAPDLRDRFARSARATAGEFSRESCAAKALSLYEDTLGRSQKNRTGNREDTWNTILKRIRIEWELFSEKAESAMDAFMAEEEESPEENLENER